MRIRRILYSIGLAAMFVGTTVVAMAMGGSAASGRPASPSPRADAGMAGMAMDHASGGAPVIGARLTRQLARARLATAKYATNLAAAKADGYQIITKDIPDMGFHFLNPAITGFDVRRPDILVYEHRDGLWQLGALEWVFPQTPTTPPLQGAQYGSFGAACHYVDGTFVFQEDQNACPSTSPATGAAFNFWHPDLVTLHVWIWYPNPDGLYASMNPLVRPFNTPVA